MLVFMGCIRWSGIFGVEQKYHSVLRRTLNSVDLCLASPSLYRACYHETGSSLYTVEVTTGRLIIPDPQTFFFFLSFN